jgi:transcriptional regulator with XRE-family HTH domain
MDTDPTDEFSTYCTAQERAFLTELGSNVRRRRKDLGMTQSELAYRIERGIDLVGRLERGIRWPALKTVIEVAIALETDVRSLFPENQRVT